MKNKWLKILSIMVLLICLALAWMEFTGRLSAGSFKAWFLVMSIVYFIAAALSVSQKPAS